jgi:hypothetical protein
MANRVFVCAVIVLWLGSMSWLMVDKVLPSFHDGEPPVASGFETDKPVAWRVSWSGKPVGYAASMRQQSVLNTTNLESHVVLRDVPILDLVPPLMRRVVGEIGSLKLDAYTRLEFDSLDNFSAFESRVSINDVPSVLQLHGEVDGSYLNLKVQFGDVSYQPKVPIPDNSALNEALFPDARLPYMYVGRRWHEEVYNPFSSPNSPIETVEAEVTGIESIEYDGKLQRVMRVEFRGPPTPGIAEESRMQAIAWVRAEDGLVLRQDVAIAASQLRFERLSDAEAVEQGNQLLGPHGVAVPNGLRGKHRRGDRGSRKSWGLTPST